MNVLAFVDGQTLIAFLLVCMCVLIRSHHSNVSSISSLLLLLLLFRSSSTSASMLSHLHSFSVINDHPSLQAILSTSLRRIETLLTLKSHSVSFNE